MTPKVKVFLALAVPVLLTDCTTKQLVVADLGIESVSRAVLGDVVRFTLAFNRDAAMGLSLGAHSRWAFSLLAACAILFLVRLLWETAPVDRMRAAALALVVAGAAGNLLDRLASPRGVVDFIDIGVGHYRFYIFNVADMSVTAGAAMLMIVLWRSARHEEARASS